MNDKCECNMCIEMEQNKRESLSDSLIKQIAMLKSDLSLSQLALKHALAANDKLRIEKELLLTLLKR